MMVFVWEGPEELCKLGVGVIKRREKEYFLLGSEREVFFNFFSFRDAELRGFFEWMYTKNYLNETVIMLLSDHGAQVSPFGF